MVVRRDFDPAALDAEYNLRAQVPDHGQFFARWAAESAVVRRHLECRLDISYGKSAAETLDHFPARKGAPLVVFFHGGYWRWLDKGDYSYLAPAYVDAGISFVSVNYALMPKADMDEIVRQARAAVEWVSRNAGKLGADPKAIFLAGHSAGAHLAAMAAAVRPVAGLCAVSGVYDLEPMLHISANQDLRLDAESAHRNSPLHLRPAQAMPTILAVGSDETPEFKRHQCEFAAAWQATRSLEVPGRHHFSVVDALGDSDHGLFDAILDMIDGRL